MHISDSIDARTDTFQVTVTQASFADVPASHWAYNSIERVFAAGITGGCGGGNYCPENPVPRDQMAVFMVPTFNLP